MHTVWIIGADGLLGKELQEACKRFDWTVYCTDKETDIGNIDALRAYAVDKKIDHIVNCAAYTNVDKAESEPDASRYVNSIGAGNVALVAAEKKAVLIHISTDFVFNGSVNAPYDETSEPSPCNVYGMSKLEGEIAVCRTCAEYFIIRTAWLFGRYGDNFVTAMLDRFLQKKDTQVVADQFGSPTYAADLAEAVCAMITSNSTEFGIYHFVNEGIASRYEFANAVFFYAQRAELLESRVAIKPVSSEDYGMKAKRPAYSALSTEKYKTVFHHVILPWQDALERFITTLTVKGNS